MKRYERKQLLERIDRDGATVGASIPDEIEVQGESLDLQEFVFEIKRRETVPEGERDRVEQAKRNLRRERNDRLDRIEAGEISFEEGEAVADSIVGIDRALTALQQLDPPDIEGEAKRAEQRDTQRWTMFLRQALGQDDTSSHGGSL